MTDQEFYEALERIKSEILAAFAIPPELLKGEKPPSTAMSIFTLKSSKSNLKYE